MDSPYAQEEIDKMFRGNPFIGPQQNVIPPQAYGLGAPMGGQQPTQQAAAGVEGMTPQEFARMMQAGSGEMGPIGALQKRAAMQPDYAAGMRDPEGQHWTRQAQRAMAGVGRGLGQLQKEAMTKTAGDQQKYAMDLMTKPEMQTEQAKMLREQWSDRPEATGKMDILKSKLPDWFKNFGG